MILQPATEDEKHTEKNWNPLMNSQLRVQTYGLDILDLTQSALQVDSAAWESQVKPTKIV